jgi:hypothetical protein
VYSRKVPSRFERDLDLQTPVAQPTSRFDRIANKAKFVDVAILEGATLLVDGTREGVLITLNPNKLSGKYPSLGLALECFGEALETSTLVEVEGDLTPNTQVDQALLEGKSLTVESHGTSLFATWAYSLPNRSFKFQGKPFEVYRRGRKVAKGSTVLEASQKALEAEEKVIEGSVIRVP